MKNNKFKPVIGVVLVIAIIYVIAQILKIMNYI